MSSHIREFRKVTAAVPCSEVPHAGQPKGGRSVAERLDAALWGALLQRAVGPSVAERSAVLCWRGYGSDTRLKMVLCEGDILHPSKPQQSVVRALQRAHSSSACQ